MKRHLLYGKYIIRHKWFVYQAGRKLGVGRWQLLIHDWHKLTPGEWFPYVETFYGNNPNAVSHAFDLAWLRHQKRGKHHWQWWVLPLDDGGQRALPMPDRYRREMVADWRGAGMAISGKDDVSDWYSANRHNMTLHADTRAWVESEIGWTEGLPMSSTPTGAMCPECGAGMMIPEPWDDFEAFCSLGALSPWACRRIAELEAERDALIDDKRGLNSEWYEDGAKILALQAKILTAPIPCIHCSTNTQHEGECLYPACATCGDLTPAAVTRCVKCEQRELIDDLATALTLAADYIRGRSSVLRTRQETIEWLTGAFDPLQRVASLRKDTT